MGSPFTTIPNVEYAPGLTCDIYMQASPAPVLAVAHGGGWDQGMKEATSVVAQKFAARGFTVVNFNYRLTRGTPQFPIDDVRVLMLWIREHIADYNGDPLRVFILGLSAGGHLAAMCAIQGTPGADRPEKILLWSPPCDLGRMVGAGVQSCEEYMGTTYAEDPAGWDLMSPTPQLAASFCRMRIVGSTNENTDGGGIARSQFDGLQRRARELGIESVLFLFTGSVHAVFDGSKGPNDITAATSWLLAA